MACYPNLSFEVRDYYEKFSKGLIEEGPYEYWGPDTVEEEARWQQWWLPIKQIFRPIDWDSAFTGRGSKSFNLLGGGSVLECQRNYSCEAQEKGHGETGSCWAQGRDA